MIAPRDFDQVLDQEFLQVRCRLMDLAAALDRLDRAPERPGHHPDPRVARIRQALEALAEPGPGRAETIQLLFSDDYDPEWRKGRAGGPQR